MENAEDLKLAKGFMLVVIHIAYLVTCIKIPIDQCGCHIT